MSETFLQMNHITKRFPGVLALSNVNFTLRKGEVHALLGENGAGKSTLMKILSGVYQPDEGDIIFEGKPVSFSDPLSAQNAGITIIHQEFNLFPELTVEENIFIGRGQNATLIRFFRFLFCQRRIHFYNTHRNTQFELVSNLYP